MTAISVLLCQHVAGPTVILDQHYDTQQGKAVPDSPYRTALVYPLKNNYVLFDGRLGHGVLDSTSAQPRMTLLINWWADKPQVNSSIGPCEIPSSGTYPSTRLVHVTLRLYALVAMQAMYTTAQAYTCIPEGLELLQVSPSDHDLVLSQLGLPLTLVFILWVAGH